MSSLGYTLFATSIGPCGIAWGPRGVVMVQLPGKDEVATRRALEARTSGATEQAPRADVKRAIEAIVALLGGEPRDLSSIALDMQGVPPFHRQVYEAARAIPPGATLSYGQLAARLGKPGAARAVGQALGRNPFAIVVPCHRVLAAKGKAGGFTAEGGIQTKLRMLAIEGAKAQTGCATRDIGTAPGFAGKGRGTGNGKGE